MKCRHCGAAIRPGSTLCSNCGSSVGRRRGASYAVCRHCGQRVRAEGRLCPACGSELRPSWRPLVLGVLAVVLVAGGYYVLTQVVSISRIQRQLAGLPKTYLVALLPQATPTFTRLPTRTTEVRPTPTRIPTMTSALMPSATATPAPTATAEPSATLLPPTATPTITPTPTPAFPYGAVALLAPPGGAEVTGPDAQITLSWATVGALATDEDYAVTLRYQASGQQQTTVAWVHGTSWPVPAEVYRRRDTTEPELQWSVRVVRRSGGSEVPLSPEGEVRSFTWWD